MAVHTADERVFGHDDVEPDAASKLATNCRAIGYERLLRKHLVPPRVIWNDPG